MRVIQVGSRDIGGGATNAAHRLHLELLKRGVDARLWVGEAREASERTAVIGRAGIVRKALGRLLPTRGLNYVEIASSFRLASHPWLSDDAVLHLHNLHGGYFNYLALPLLTRRRPAIWTLHDMWAFTGHCGYSLECERWRAGCGACPHPEAYPAIGYDTTALEIELKRWTYRRARLIVASPSAWLAGLVRASILGDAAIHHVPYGLDTELYRPREKLAARRALGLPANKRILLWAASHLGNWRKGGDLVQALDTHLPDSLRKECELVAIGRGTEALRNTLRLSVTPRGFVASEEEKALLYAAADVLVFPSRLENLPLVPMEALACGLPAVAFRVGGVAELVVHEQTGLLVPAFDVARFCQSVERLLTAPDQREAMGHAARALAVRDYRVELMADRYLALYREALAAA